jgi:tetratricopeptide (TPR) repeat protein
VRSEVPAALELLCQKALEKRLPERLENMRAFADELRRFLAGEPSQLRAPTPLERAGRWVRKHAVASWSVGLLTFSAGALAWFRHMDANDRSRLEAASNQREARAERERRAAQREALFARAQVAIEMGDMDEAVRLASEANALDAADPTGHLFLAAGYARFERIAERDAELALARAKGFQGPPAEGATALELAGYALFLHSQRDFALYAEAEGTIQRALALDPTLYALELTRFEMRVATGDQAGALRALSEFQGHIPQREPQFQLLEALRQELAGDPAAALATLDELARHPELDAEGLRTLHWHRNAGRLRVALGQFERAEQLLRQALVFYPGDCWSWDNLGVLYFKRLEAGEDDESVRSSALDCAARAEACSSSLFNPHLIRAGLAVRELDRLAKESDPRANPAWAVAEEALERLRRIPEAAVVEPERRRLEAHLSFLDGARRYLRGDFARAEPLLAAALEARPDDLRSAALLGQCLWHLDRPADGMEVLDRALERWDDPELLVRPEQHYFGAILAWRIGNAAKLDDAPAFTRARERFLEELRRGTAISKEELLSAAEFLATASGSLRSCSEAWRLIDDHDLGRAFEGQASENEALRVLEAIAAACP